MANRKKVTLETEFKHNFIVEADGRTLYTCPVEIKSQADLDNYGITWDDCQTLNFHGSEKVTVYFMKVESRALAEYQWSYLNSKHSCKLNSAMCMIPGKWKQWVRCTDSVFCAKCPHNADCKPPVISWDKLISTGYEPTDGASLDEQAMAKLEYQAIRDLMDAEDVRIARSFEMKELMGYDVKEIAAELGVSEPCIYQLLNRVREIGKAYREKNH